MHIYIYVIYEYPGKIGIFIVQNGKTLYKMACDHFLSYAKKWISTDQKACYSTNCLGYRNLKSKSNHYNISSMLLTHISHHISLRSGRNK